MYPIASISESGTTATVTLSAPGIPVSNIAVGDSIFIVGNIAGYNNTLSLAPTGWTVSDVVSTTQIQFVAASSGLSTGSGGTLGDSTRTSAFLSGSVLNPVTVSSFTGVTCGACHTSTTVAAELLANPLYKKCGIGWRNGYAHPRRESGPAKRVVSDTPGSGKPILPDLSRTGSAQRGVEFDLSGDVRCRCVVYRLSHGPL